MTQPLRVLFSVPAYWPAHSFGGPVEVVRRLAHGLGARGHDLHVFTTTLTALDARASARSRVEAVDGVPVHYLATPARFRWMGLTPTLPLHLERLPRPDVVHIFGFRDAIGTGVAAWCRARRIPYVLEGLGMVAPKHRKVLLKRALDSTAFRGVLRRAALLVAASGIEASEYASAGIQEDRIVVRPHGFPEVERDADRGSLRRLVGIDDTAPIVLNVGRIAHGKGLEMLIHVAASLPEVQFAIVGPDGGHGVDRELRSLLNQLGVEERVHFTGPLPPSEVRAVYADADVFVLPSRSENFGMVAAEAAAAGAAIVVTDRCGVAELFADRGALVVPYDEAAVRDAVARLLQDPALRSRLGEQAQDVAAEWSWTRVVDIQEELYERIAGRP